jgi:uncharacterized protein (DUF1501 family)
MAIWQSARLDPDEHDGLGWLGRSLDALPGAAEGMEAAMFIGSGPPPSAVRGRRAVASALERIEDFTLDAAVRRGRDAIADTPGDDLAAFVRRSTLDAYAGADRIGELARGRDGDARYPASGLAGRLRLIARLLKGGYAARVFYTTQAGYDTHAGQLPTHSGLLSELSGALRAFLDDLAAAGLADRVLVLGFSEFGRRVAENGSAGTDHGTAGPVLLAGPGVKAGLTGSYPSLTDLEDGDLRIAVDFRRIYSTILANWMGLPSGAALGGDHGSLRLLKG